MATTTGNKLSAEEYLEVLKFDTFNQALNFWASSKEVIPYKTWQTVYNQIRKMYLQKDSNLSREATLQEISQQCSAAWKAKMEELHGASWRRTLAAAVSRRAEIAQSSTHPRRGADGGLGAGFPTSSPKVPRRADGGRGTGFPTGPPEAQESTARASGREAGAFSLVRGIP